MTVGYHTYHEKNILLLSFSFLLVLKQFAGSVSLFFACKYLKEKKIYIYIQIIKQTNKHNTSMNRERERDIIPIYFVVFILFFRYTCYFSCCLYLWNMNGMKKKEEICFSCLFIRCLMWISFISPALVSLLLFCFHFKWKKRYK